MGGPKSDVSELRYAVRNLLKSPGFAITAVLTLALGIGASTAVFTIVDSVILKPLSYRDSGRLVVIWEKVKFLANAPTPYTGPNPKHELIWQERSTAFESICLLRVGTLGVSVGTDHPQMIGSIRAQPNFLQILKVKPFMGRDFTAEDAISGHEHVAIIAYSMWEGLFHGDSNVIGKSVRVADTPYEIAGVLPKDFVFPKRTVLNSFPSRQTVTTAPPVEMVTPLVVKFSDYGWNSDYGNNIALARLKPGVTVRHAESQLNAIQRQIVNEMPAGQRDASPDSLLAYVQPMQDAMVSNSRRGLWMLMAAVIGVMLIACVNLANAQLGRAIMREREASVRTALGASAWQIIWSALAESVVMALAGGAAGSSLAFGALGLFRRYSPIELPRMSEIQPNITVLLFAVLALAAAVLVFGMAPALHLLRTDPQQALQNSGRMQGSRTNSRARLILIGVQVCGCTALLLITGLFAKSLATLMHNARGFDTTNVVAAEVNLRGHIYDEDAARVSFDEHVLEKLRALPGVTHTALYSAMPLEGETWIDGIFLPEQPSRHGQLANFRWVSADYFRLVRQVLVAGRFFDEGDRDSNRAVISETTAKAVWPHENPIGRTMLWHGKPFTVIGVAGDSLTNSLKDAPTRMVYLPYRTNTPYTSYFLVRSEQRPDSLIPAVRRAIWAQDPGVTIARVKTLESQVKDSLAMERFQTFILVAFGAAALMLAMLGVYGVLSYVVAGRTQEFGVRMALGATRQSIYRLTMNEAARPVVIGLFAGWAASIAAGRLVRNLLYGIGTMDWSVTAIVAVVFFTCAAAAAFVPARRAATADPMQALRNE